MGFVADLHIHSHYSISTSPLLTPEHLDLWAALKGITVVGTGDFTHPGWLAELEKALVPAEDGLYRLRPELRREVMSRAETEGLPVPADYTGPAPNGAGGATATRFLLTAEISNIYRRDGRTRKVHNLILAPSFAAARNLQRALGRRGNITSDGRPILGLDSRDLLEITLEVSPGALLIPAHIWTPWFSVLGARSGFDRISDCYADLSGHIRAVETGLSSDPPMNWLCSSLDGYTLISNSDAHSPEKLGREANLFDTALSYPGIATALNGEDSGGFAGTIEFFPQEGKYHFDGHRKCRVSCDPLETLRRGGVCPVCGKPLTVGVLNRVAQLADRDTVPDPAGRRPFHSLIPLKEILSEIHGVGPGSKAVARTYSGLVRRAGSELAILLDLPVPELTALGGELLAEGVRRMRAAEVRVEAGFDGEYGSVHLFASGDQLRAGFPELPFQPAARSPGGAGSEAPSPPPRRPLVEFDVAAYRRQRAAAQIPSRPPQAVSADDRPADRQPGLSPRNPQHGLTGAQAAAAAHLTGPALILAGPGTGKTRTLAARIAALMDRETDGSGGILAVTFTNKAAREMRARLEPRLRAGLRAGLQPARVPALARPPAMICTFHSLGRALLSELLADSGRSPDFTVLDQDDRARLLSRLPGCPKNRAAAISAAVGTAKQRLRVPDPTEDPALAQLFRLYQERLQALGAFDLDDLLFEPVRRLEADPARARGLRERFPWLLVDEYQDINEAQYRLVRLLAPEPSANLWAVGDPNQAIYAFRGADIRYIQRFLRDYPGAAVYRLSESFRCSDTILRASSQVLAIAEPVHHRPPEAVTGAAGDAPELRIRISEYPSEASEAEGVARTIESMIGGLRFFSLDSDISEGEMAEGIQSLADFAVLCRIARQADSVERAFRDHSIPYQKAETEPFWKLEPARSVLSLLRALRLPDIGRSAPELLPELPDAAWAVIEPLAAAVRGGKIPVRELIVALAELCPTGLAEGEAVLGRLLELGLSFDRDLEAFLEHTALGNGPDSLRTDRADHRGDSELVSLLTMHAAKGLEFTCVFIVGCEDGLLPYSLIPGQKCDIEEERRLFYVGMTRARRYLYLSHAGRRVMFGRQRILPRSPFVDAIERELTETEHPGRMRRRIPEDRQLGLF